MRVRTVSALVILLLVVAAPAAAGGGGHADGSNWTCRAFLEGDTITMHDSCFDGIGHVVDVGTTLTVVNEGALPHTFTAVDRTFDTGTLQPGESAQITVEEPGPHPVYCTLHASLDGRGMAGLLVVNDVASDELAEPVTQPARAETTEESAATRWAWWTLSLAVVLLTVATIGALRMRRGTSSTSTVE